MLGFVENNRIVWHVKVSHGKEVIVEMVLDSMGKGKDMKKQVVPYKLITRKTNALNITKDERCRIFGSRLMEKKGRIKTG